MPTGSPWPGWPRLLCRRLAAPDVLFIVLDTVLGGSAEPLRLRQANQPGPAATGHLRGIRLRLGVLVSSLHTPLGRQLLHWPLAARTRGWLAGPAPTWFPTLAEYLASRGYETAGFFVVNVEYCSYDAGLVCGFAHYEDDPFRPATSAGSCGCHPPVLAWDTATWAGLVRGAWQ